MTNRGAMSAEVMERASQMGITDFDIRALRLIPYVQFLVVNRQRVDPRKINNDERKWISFWRGKKWLTGGANASVCVSLEFWNFMCDVLWLAYAEHDPILGEC